MGFKRITAYDATELDQAVQNGINECQKAGLDFYRVLNGIDAYMERRKRKLELELNTTAATNVAEANKTKVNPATQGYAGGERKTATEVRTQQAAQQLVDAPKNKA